MTAVKRWFSQLGFMASVVALCFRMRKATTVTLIALIAAGVLANTALAFAQGTVVDGVLAHHRAQTLVAVVLGAVFLMVSMMGGLAQQTFSRELSEASAHELTKDLLTWSTQAATLEHLDEPEYLDRQSRVLRDSGAVAYAAWATISGVSTAVALVITLVLLARIHPVLLVLLVFTVPPVWLAGKAGVLHLNIIDANEHFMRWEADLHQIATTADSLAEIMGSDQSEQVDAATDLVWRELIRRELKVRIQTVLLTVAGWTVYAVGLAFATWWIAGLVRAGQATIGDGALGIALSISLLTQVNALLYVRNNVIESGRTTEHYLWLRRRAGELPRAEAPITALHQGLSLDDVSFRYPDTDRDVLSGLTLDIPAGSVLGVVGVNGAGKTTLVKLLTGLYSPTGGRLTADGELVRPGQLSQSTAGTFQDYVQPQVLAHEAVGLGHLPGLHDLDAIEDAGQRGGASTFVHRLPDAWQTQLGDIFEGHRPSQGQWQRLALSRGMMRPDPVLLVLDEPTAALDPQAEHDLFTRFAAHARALATRTGAITVLVSHRFSTVTMTDHIIVLDAGRLTEQGSHADLMRLDGTYAQLFRQQAQGYRSDQ